MIPKKPKPRGGTYYIFLSHTKQNNQHTPLNHHTQSVVFDHGSNNVSRWMTWLPISLKNAAKCDKWYQLQNHSITESLNAKGAWEKLFTSHPRACRISVSNNKNKIPVLRIGNICERVFGDWLNSGKTETSHASAPCVSFSLRRKKTHKTKNQKQKSFIGLLSLL